MVSDGDHNVRVTKIRRLLLVPHPRSDFHKISKRNAISRSSQTNVHYRCPALVRSYRCRQPARSGKLDRFSFSVQASTLSRRLARYRIRKCICQTERMLKRILRKVRSIRLARTTGWKLNEPWVAFIMIIRMKTEISALKCVCVKNMVPPFFIFIFE